MNWTGKYASRSSEQRLVDIFPVIFLVYPYFCIWSSTYKGRQSRSRTRPQPSWSGWWGTRRGRRWPPWRSPSCSPDRDQDCQKSTEFLNFDIATNGQLFCSDLQLVTHPGRPGGLLLPLPHGPGARLALGALPQSDHNPGVDILNATD